MRRAVIAGFAALAALWLAAQSFQGKRTPAYTAVAAVPELGLVLAVKLFVLSDLTEFERHLAITADGAALTARMADIHGSSGPTVLYRVAGSGEAVLSGPDDAALAIATKPLRRLDQPSRPRSDWICVGAFELSLASDPAAPARGAVQTFAFVPAVRAGERRAEAAGGGCADAVAAR